MSMEKRTYKKVIVEESFKREREVVQKDGKIVKVPFIDKRIVADVGDAVGLIADKKKIKIETFYDMSGQEILSWILKDAYGIVVTTTSKVPSKDRLISNLKANKDALTNEDKAELRKILGL